MVLHQSMSSLQGAMHSDQLQTALQAAGQGLLRREAGWVPASPETQGCSEVLRTAS